MTKNRYKLKQKDGEDSSSVIVHPIARTSAFTLVMLLHSKYVDRRRGPDRSTAYPHPARPRSENAGGSTIETQSAVTSGASTVNQATTTIPSTSKTVQYRRDESGNITEVYFGYADCVSTQQKDSNPPERANEDTRMFADFTTMDTVDD